MPRLRTSWVVLASLLAMAAPACGRGSPGAANTGSGTASRSGTSPTEITAKDFDPSNFGDSTTIDNQWLPLKPGTRWTWEGHAFDGTERIRRRVVSTVTDLTKVIDGVRNVVVLELDYSSGELEEAEIALFAQDDDGSVWHFGEYPEEYEEGKIVKTPAWIAGLEGARPGVMMQAVPRLGSPSYAEGWGPRIGWNDRAQTYQIGAQTCVPFDCYQNVLLTKEFSRTEPGAFQTKYYAPGVGNVRVGWGGPKEEEQEVLALTELTHLGPEALANVRQTVLAQEKRAYALSPDVYGRTPPAEPCSSCV